MTNGSARATLGITRRLLLLVGVGALTPLALLGWVAVRTIGTLEQRIADERMASTRALAVDIDRRLSLVLQTLSAAASSPALSSGAADTPAVRDVLRRAWLTTQVLDGIALVDTGGRTAALEPVGLMPARETGFASPLAALAASNRPGATGIVRIGAMRYVALTAPVHDQSGAAIAMVAGLRAVDGNAFRALLSPVPPGARAELLDGDGQLIAAAGAPPRSGDGDTAVVHVGRGPRTARSTVLRDGSSEPELAAFVPLSMLPWTVLVRQPQREVFAASQVARVRFTGLAVLAAAIALAFAWGAARSVVDPLRTLTGAAQRIAGGDLSVAVPELPPDELGVLGRSFESMRVRLADSIARITRTNEELEQRVAARTEALQRAHEELRERDQLRGRLLQQVISAQEDERKRLARELHDETCQTLAAVGLRLDAALQSETLDRARSHATDARGLLSQTIDEVRAVIFDLRPSVLDDLGLLPAIRWLADRQLHGTGTRACFDFEDDRTRLPPAVEIAVFRAVQEAIANVARHAAAETVLIEIGRDATGLHLLVEDDGVGFDAAAVQGPEPSGRGLGLLGMRERIELVGGRVSVDSSIGEGTRVRITIPPQEPDAS